MTAPDIILLRVEKGTATQHGYGITIKDDVFRPGHVITLECPALPAPPKMEVTVERNECLIAVGRGGFHDSTDVHRAYDYLVETHASICWEFTRVTHPSLSKRRC